MPSVYINDDFCDFYMAELPPAQQQVAAPFDLGVVGPNRSGRIVAGVPPGETEIPRADCNGTECAFIADGIFPFFAPTSGGKPMELRSFRIPPGVLHDRVNTAELLADRPVDFTWLELDLDAAE